MVLLLSISKKISREGIVMCDLPRLRGIKDSYAWLKEQDPETQITLKGYTIMVKTGVIPSVRRGNRYLIDINTLPDAIRTWVDSGMSGAKRKECFDA